MTVYSAGILLFRRREGSGPGGAAGTRPGGADEREERVEFLLVHPGGPYFAKKDGGVWSIPKGEYDPSSESALSAALREFAEETGAELHGEPFADLGSIEQRRGKMVNAFAFEGDFDAGALASNEFEMEWPPRSGRVGRFPEVDRAAWFDSASAAEKILPAQSVFIERLFEALTGEPRRRDNG